MSTAPVKTRPRRDGQMNSPRGEGDRAARASQIYTAFTPGRSPCECERTEDSRAGATEEGVNGLDVFHARSLGCGRSRRNSSCARATGRSDHADGMDAYPGRHTDDCYDRAGTGRPLGRSNLT